MPPPHLCRFWREILYILVPDPELTKKHLEGFKNKKEKILLRRREHPFLWTPSSVPWPQNKNSALWASQAPTRMEICTFINLAEFIREMAENIHTFGRSPIFIYGHPVCYKRAVNFRIVEWRILVPGSAEDTYNFDNLMIIGGNYSSLRQVIIFVILADSQLRCSHWKTILKWLYRHSSCQEPPEIADSWTAKVRISSKLLAARNKTIRTAR